MDEKKVRETIAWLETKRKIHKYGAYTSPIIPKEQIDMIEERYDLAIEALEKQLSKKVDIMDYPLDDINFRCPVCKSEYICEKEHEHFYCPTCGQKLDWKEAEEEVV